MKTRTQNAGYPKPRTKSGNPWPKRVGCPRSGSSWPPCCGFPPAPGCTPPIPRTLRALTRQLHRLVMHPDATAEDLAVGMRLAGAACLDAMDWLTLACLDPSAPSTTRH